MTRTPMSEWINSKRMQILFLHLTSNVRSPLGKLTMSEWKKRALESAGSLVHVFTGWTPLTNKLGPQMSPRHAWVKLLWKRIGSFTSSNSHKRVIHISTCTLCTPTHLDIVKARPPRGEWYGVIDKAVEGVCQDSTIFNRSGLGGWTMVKARKVDIYASDMGHPHRRVFFSNFALFWVRLARFEKYFKIDALFSYFLVNFY